MQGEGPVPPAGIGGTRAFLYCRKILKGGNMKRFALLTAVALALALAACDDREARMDVADPVWPAVTDTAETELPFRRKELTAADISLTKDFLYDKYTLDDTYPYQDTVRSFKWDIIRQCLAFIENLQAEPQRWAVLQNYKNLNGEAPVTARYVRNEFNRVSDTLGIERYQSVPLYLPSDTLTPVRYGRDGSLARLVEEVGSYWLLEPVTLETVTSSI